MKNQHIGNIIKNRRINLKMTQEPLAYGILDVSELSHIENGHRLPSPKKAKLIFERLGLDKNHYLSLLDCENFEFEELKYQIQIALMHGDFNNTNKLLENIQKLKNIDKAYEKQFILQSKALVDTTLTLSAKHNLLNEAIILTCPKFKISNIKDLILNESEISIIINIAVCYQRMEENNKAILIYSQLLDYVENHFMSLEDIVALQILISFNYSKALVIEEDYKKAISIADKGINNCRKYNKMNLMGELLTEKAYSLCKRKCMPEGEYTYKRAFSYFFLMEEPQKMEVVIEDAKQFNIILN